MSPATNTADSLLQGLNPQQREAAAHTEGPLLVLAGAGTGKTKVLTSRLGYILQNGLAFPNEIMAVTFTNKAAREMAERVERLVGQSATAGGWLGTFPALGVRLLRRHAEQAGLQPDFSIIDVDDQKRLLKTIIGEAGIDETRWPARQLAGIISRWKDNGWKPEDVPAEEDRAFDNKGRALYARYQQQLKALNAADFGDLLLKALDLFRDHPDIARFYQNKIRYVLVDEYQDTNAVQYMWLRLLVMGHKNICVVGDDDQSIYAWRGAQVENILRFETDFPGAKVVRLEQNYRSKGNILKAASGVIQHNKTRHGKTLWTEAEEGEKVELHPVFDGREEARMIAERIERGVRDGAAYGDHAILVRTAAQTRPLEERLMQQGIGYVVVGGLRFYERKEIRDIVAYMRLIYSDSDSLAFERIVNVPKRGIGDSTIKSLQEMTRSDNTSMLSSAQKAVTQGLLPPRAMTPLRDLLDKINGWRKIVDETTLDRLAEQVAEDSGYMEMLRTDKNKEEARGRIENIKELVRALQEYGDLEAFLEHVSLVMDRDDNAENADHVILTTVHAAKGLEFNTVFIPGFEEGIFPHQRSLNEEGMKGLEEERRLAYVAITRARKKLILSYTSSRQMYGQWQPSTASRFIDELPEDCVQLVGSSNSYGSGRPQVGSYMDGRSAGDYGRRREPLLAHESVPNINTTDFANGQRVFHQKFGYGTVKRSEGTGSSARLIIQFEKAGQKKLVASMANLEKA